MPFTLPPFVQYQGAIVPLKTKMMEPPDEGNTFINIEIDWGSYGQNAVQLQPAANSPVAFSKISSLYVDNRRCGVDINFIFPDSGFVLPVPARTAGLYPVLTTALMFYAVATGATMTDVSIFQILNFVPPPVAVAESTAQNAAGAVGVAIVAGTTAIAPAGISGTLNTLSVTGALTGVAGGNVAVIIADHATGAPNWSES